MILRCVAGGADTVVNLAAGMDARPYRMKLPPHLRWWINDLASPGLLRILQKAFARELQPVGVAMRFAPREGPRWFGPLGWTPVEVQSFLKTAARLGRLGPFLRLIALLPDSKGAKPDQPWGGMCLFERRDSSATGT